MADQSLHRRQFLKAATAGAVATSSAAALASDQRDRAKNPVWGPTVVITSPPAGSRVPSDYFSVYGTWTQNEVTQAYIDTSAKGADSVVSTGVGTGSGTWQANFSSVAPGQHTVVASSTGASASEIINVMNLT